MFVYLTPTDYENIIRILSEVETTASEALTLSKVQQIRNLQKIKHQRNVNKAETLESANRS